MCLIDSVDDEQAMEDQVAPGSEDLHQRDRLLLEKVYINY